MIEVNLLPGGKKRAGGKAAFSFSAPDMKGLQVDPYMLAAVVAVLLTVGMSGWWYVGMGARRGEVTVALEEALEDSAAFADLIRETSILTARRDSVAQRVSVIQEIDANRFIWSHILDEVARAIPDYTWLTQVIQVAGGANLEFRILGLAGNNFAVTNFMENLEVSPFLRSVRLIQTEQSFGGDLGASNQQIYSFILEAAYDAPSMDLIETVPLFETLGDVVGGEGGE